MTLYQYKLNKIELESKDSKITGKEILISGGLEPVENFELLIKTNEKGFEPVQLTETIDLQRPGIEGFIAKPYKYIPIYVDDDLIEMDECFTTPDELLEKTGKNPEDFFLVQKKGEIEIGYKNDREHRIALKDNLKFYSYEIEPMDITIIVNAREEKWNKKTISFIEVIALASKHFPPDQANTIYSVEYSDGIDIKPEGSLVKGKSVQVKHRMIFDVTPTDKS